MNETQLLKGILEGSVLGIIAKQETYGYEILTQLEASGFENIIEGTLYPVLTRLSKKGYISCRLTTSPLGPTRKNYSITEEGTKWLHSFKENYQKIIHNANRILFEEEEL